MSLIFEFINLIKSPIGIFELVSLFIIILCCFSVLLAIFIDFIKFDIKDETKRKKKSIVATGSMLLFFVCFYFLIRFNVGAIEVGNLILRITTIIIGLIIIIIGTFVNIRGRVDLGKNWANHIKIYKNHTLIEKGMYRIVRHPLYASLIWAFYGACLVYLNYYAFFLNTFVFIPFMYYRAKQEEELLEKEFFDYNKYKLKVGMFFPKLF